MRRHLTSVVAAAALALSGGAALAANSSIARVSLLSAPFGTGSYVLAAALQDISNKAAGNVRVDASESPGFLYNIKELANNVDARKTTIVGSGKGVLALAVAGEKPFKKKYPKLKLIANYELVSVWLATLDPKLKNVDDLVGKRVALGRAAQINWAVEPEKLIRVGWGLGEDKVKISYLGPKQAVSALLDGHVAAAVVGGYMGPGNKGFVLSPQTTQFMASGRDVHFIPWGEPQVKKTIASGIKVVPVDLPPNTIKGISQKLPVFADTAGWFVAEDFPEQLAYQVTKMIIQNVDKFAQYHALGKLMSRQSLVYGFDEDEIAPGALKAYREAGILK